jgi:serine/threonine protein phosphatase PrpC
MIPAERSHLHAAAKSHPGMSGKNNEDRYAVTAYLIENGDPISTVFAVVSDGVGGHRAGEVAAEFAVEMISQSIAESETTQPIQTLKNAIVHASNTIYTQSESNDEYKGMGATCACCWVIDDRLYLANVGDTRIYLIRDNSIRQLSTDHTWIQEAIDAGIMTREEVNDHPQSHVIRRFLGSSQPVVPDIRLRLHEGETDAQTEANQGMVLMPEDQLVLCSDGLTDLVSEDEILKIFETKEQEDAIDALIELANLRGGHDNITIISLQNPGITEKTQPVPVPSRGKKKRTACLVFGILLLLVFIISAGVYFYLVRPEPSQAPVLVTTNTALPPTATISPTELSSPSQTPVNTESDSIIPSATVGVSPSASPLLDTLTPWPTNTNSP